MDNTYERKSLEDKIDYMWKTIEDLKLKIAEEREFLKQEKSENERMKVEQVRMRKKLSMFHLPQCPAHSSPAPCPVHPHKFYPESKHHHHGDNEHQSNGQLANGYHAPMGYSENPLGDSHYPYPESWKWCTNFSKDNRFDLENVDHGENDTQRNEDITPPRPANDLFDDPSRYFPELSQHRESEASTDFTLRLSKLWQGMDAPSSPAEIGQEGDLFESPISYETKSGLDSTLTQEK